MAILDRRQYWKGYGDVKLEKSTKEKKIRFAMATKANSVAR
jgi:hypothetical protein